MSVHWGLHPFNLPSESWHKQAHEKSRPLFTFLTFSLWIEIWIAEECHVLCPLLELLKHVEKCVVSQFLWLNLACFNQIYNNNHGYNINPCFFESSHLNWCGVKNNALATIDLTAVMHVLICHFQRRSNYNYRYVF